MVLPDAPAVSNWENVAYAGSVSFWKRDAHETLDSWGLAYFRLMDRSRPARIGVWIAYLAVLVSLWLIGGFWWAVIAVASTVGFVALGYASRR